MTIRDLVTACSGVSFSEVLVAMAIVSIGLTGAMGAFQAAEKAIVKDAMASRALAAAESRIEAKRATEWGRLLEDDLNHDGRPDVIMRDDGRDGDAVAEDGTYSAIDERDGLRLTWMVTPNRAGNLRGSGFIVIEAHASYETDAGYREVGLATIRANPFFAGQ
jgi:prepilin-type N-terminal cleavage/methylation domain-containing protein